MTEVKYNANSINHAIETRVMDRDISKPRIQKDRYNVKIKDDKGKEYEIRYFF
jgi:hypothetical protein